MSHKQKEPRAAAQFAKQVVQGDAAIVPPKAGDYDLDVMQGHTFLFARTPAEQNFHRGLKPQQMKGTRQIRRDIARQLLKEQKRSGGAA